MCSCCSWVCFYCYYRVAAARYCRLPPSPPAARRAAVLLAPPWPAPVHTPPLAAVCCRLLLRPCAVRAWNLLLMLLAAAAAHLRWHQDRFVRARLCPRACCYCSSLLRCCCATLPLFVAYLLLYTEASHGQVPQCGVCVRELCVCAVCVRELCVWLAFATAMCGRPFASLGTNP